MKTLILSLLIFLACVSARASTIGVTDAASHIGQTATVEGVVSEVHVARSGTTFIDMGGQYPNQAFTGVIFASDAAKFGDMSALTEKTVNITGAIQLYRGKPEIILRSADQVKLVR